MTEGSDDYLCSELAAIVGGRLVGPDLRVHGLATQLEEVRGGELFVPVVKTRDGHEDVAAAFAAGAGATLWARETTPEREPAIVVQDTLAALRRLGEHGRARFGDAVAVVGVTGSVGKTTTKDLIAGVLARAMRVGASPLSRNNRYSVPWVLFRAARDSEALVIEMAARDVGHVAEHCRLVRPSIGVVTRIAVAHLSGFGTIERVAQGKGELVEALPRDGLAVLDAEGPWFDALARRSAAPVIGWGRARGEVRAGGVVLDELLRPSFVLCSAWGTCAVKLSVRGEHQVGNALAAAAVGLHLGVSVDEVAAGLAAVEPCPSRMQLERSRAGGWVINDACNASPDSMLAALAALAALPARRRVAVLGPMAELGDGEASAHRRVVERARELGLELVAIGTQAYGRCELADVDAAAEALAEPGEGEAVLIKGSRVAALERLAQRWCSPD